MMTQGKINKNYASFLKFREDEIVSSKIRKIEGKYGIQLQSINISAILSMIHV